MGDIIRFPTLNSKKRKRLRARRTRERLADLSAMIAGESDFSDIKTNADLEALAVNDPYRFLLYTVQAASA